MLEEEFKEILDKKETDTVEFKSWVNERNMKEIISLAVDVRTWFRWGSLIQDTDHLIMQFRLQYLAR